MPLLVVTPRGLAGGCQRFGRMYRRHYRLILRPRDEFPVCFDQCEVSGSHGGNAPCSLIEIDRRFRGDRPEDGGSKHI